MTKKNIMTPLLAFAALALLQQGIACTDDDPDDPWVELDCSQYCQRAKECNDDVDEDDCEERCLSALANCQADERDEAQDLIDACTDAACDDIVGCTVDAGAKCYFGL